ncbi:MAG: amidohydrolase [Tissierellia bacterium]|nr:amidohydrolase [Tissierellia bacterium]
MDIKAIGKKYVDYVVEMRRWFHKYPELSNQEFETQKKIIEELEKMGIEYEKVAGTGVLATIKGKSPGKTVLLRSDMDALEVTEALDVEFKSQNEGVMHACGHDNHMSMLLGAAQILKDIKDELKGEVKLIFQPAEEVAQGALRVLEETDLANTCDAVFGMHVWGELPSGMINIEAGPRMAAAGVFDIKVKGVSGHGSTPHACKDALVCAAAIVMNLQTIVSRMSNPMNPLVVTTGTFNSGTRFNIIAGDAHLTGTTRCYDDDLMQMTEDAILRIAKDTADAYGMEVEVSHQVLTKTTKNDPKVTEIAKAAAVKLYGEESLMDFPKATASEDFSFFQDKIPGVFAFLGTYDESIDAIYSNHHQRYTMDEKNLERGMNLFAQFTYDYLNEA